MLIHNDITDTIRRDLFRQYMKEIYGMIGEKYDQAECDDCFYTYLRRTFIEWHDIFFGTKPVGFFVVGKDPECHPDADYFVMQTYVLPEFRRKGLASFAISEYIRKNRDGIYVLDIINSNNVAHKFWANTFSRSNYAGVVLRPAAHGAGKNTHMYAWRPATGVKII